MLVADFRTVGNTDGKEAKQFAHWRPMDAGPDWPMQGKSKAKITARKERVVRSFQRVIFNIDI